MSSCDNHYGAQCNVSRLNGSSSVTCVAPCNQHPGVWNNSIPKCEGNWKTKQLSGLMRIHPTQLYGYLYTIVATKLPIRKETLFMIK